MCEPGQTYLSTKSIFNAYKCMRTLHRRLSTLRTTVFVLDYGHVVHKFIFVVSLIFYSNIMMNWMPMKITDNDPSQWIWWDACIYLFALSLSFYCVRLFRHSLYLPFAFLVWPIIELHPIYVQRCVLIQNKCHIYRI